MWWLQDPNQSTVGNLNNIRCTASRYFRNKKKEYLKAKIDELETNIKIKNIIDLHRGINDFKKGYQPKTNIVQDEKGDLVTDSHSILNRWKPRDVRQSEIYVAEPLVPEQSAYKFEMAIKKLKRHKSPGIDQSPAALIKAGG